MDAELRPSKSKLIILPSLSKKRRHESIDGDSEFSDHLSAEDVYSQHDEENRSSSAEDYSRNLSISETKKRKTIRRESWTQDTLAQPSSSSSSSSRINFHEINSDHRTIRNRKQSKQKPKSGMHRAVPLVAAEMCETVLKSDERTRSLSPVSIHLPIPDFSTFTPDSPSDNDDVPLPGPTNVSTPSPQGATSTWSSTPQAMKVFDFIKEQKLLVPPPSDPYEAFRLIIDDDLLDLTVRETNANAYRMLSNRNIPRHSRINQWKDVTRSELLTFLGLLLHTGTIQLIRISDYWKKHYLFNIQCFRQFMSRNRFLLILRCLHFTSESCDEDRLLKIRPFMDHFNTKMESIYCPGKQLSLDESAVLLRGRLLFRQYIRNKPHKYGIKLYVLAEPDGTVLKYQVYAGANDETSGPGDASKIVLKLMEEKLDQGHHVYMGNHYNSYSLAVKLLERNTYCTGTLRENRKGNPVDIGTIQLEKGQNKSFFLNGVHIGKWRDKRYVMYISTEHDNEMIETTTKRGAVVMKPCAIVHYNNFMSGVDLQDQMLAYYPIQRKTLRWYKKLFIHMVQISLSNAMYLYNKFSTSHKLNFYDFRLKVIESLLVEPNESSRCEVLTVKHELTKIEKTRQRQKKVGKLIKDTVEVVRKECKGCRAQKKRVQTIYECKQCDGAPGFCTKCFCQVHSSAE